MRSRVGVLIVVILGLCMSVPVQGAMGASFFDDSDGKWWLNEDGWKLVETDDPRNIISISDVDSQLQFTSSDRGGDRTDGADKWYEAQWAFNLDKDFDVAVQYTVRNISPIDTTTKVVGGLEFGLTSSLETWDYDYWISSKYSLYPVSSGYYDLEYSYVEAIAEENVESTDPTLRHRDDEARVERVSDTGSMGFHYDWQNDRLTFYAIDGEEGIGSDIDFGGFDVEGLRTEEGVNTLYLSLDAYSRNALFQGVDVNYSDLRVTMAPEPISSALFIAGGLGMLIRRKYGKKS